MGWKKSLSRVAGMFFCAAAPSLVSYAAPVVFDVANDFNSTVNSGTWTYGEKPSTFGNFQLMTLHTAGPNLLGNNSLVGWNSNEQQPSGLLPYYPLVVKNVSNNAITWQNNEGPGTFLTFPVGAVFMCPAIVDRSVVRFTAPSTGAYALAGSFDRLQFSVEKHTQEIQIVSGNATLFDQSITGNLTSDPFSFPSLFLTAGQTIDFQVAGVPDFYGSTMRLNATISATALPLPGGAGIGLFTITLFGTVRLAHRRRIIESC